MGCDYYILKLLKIFFSDNDKDYLEIQVDSKRGYYEYDQYDEDEEDYEEKMNEYIKITLTPKMKPILIYVNNSFNTSTFEIKYKTLVENEIQEHDKKWGEITKIIKVEARRD